jgi:hypothetical protein
MNSVTGRVRLASKSRRLVLGILVAGLTGGAALAYYVCADRSVSPDADEESPQWASISKVDRANLVTVGKNAYFNLEPGYRLRYSDGKLTRTVTVRRKTKLVDGVKTRVVEEKEEQDGKLNRVSWKYLAFDETTSALYCFGVHVQTYQDGKLVGHRGWRSGAHGALFTLAMPAQPKVGDTLMRGSAKRLYEVTDVRAKAVTPAGIFTNCLFIQAKDSGEQVQDAGERKAADKLFAPGIGLVKNGSLALVKIAQTVPRKMVEADADAE